MKTPIEPRQLEFARMRLAEQFHAALLKMLIECEVDEKFVAKRIGKSEGYVREKLNDPSKLTLDDIATFPLAVAADFNNVSFTPIRYRDLTAEFERFRQLRAVA